MSRSLVRLGHIPRRRLGQHFLVDRGVVSRIIDALAPRRGDRVVEIGPGLGALTFPLLERLDHLDVIEIDRDLARRLAAAPAAERLAIHCADALAFDFASLGADLRIVGNLPYNISTPLLFRFARFAAALRDITVMLQKEVVDRMGASAGSSAYGRLSVMVQYHFALARLFDVGPGAFRPPPRVSSAVVRLTPKPIDRRGARDEVLFAKLVAAAFNQRRKTLRNALRGLASAAQLAAAGIDPGLRGENLSVDDYVRLGNCLTA